MKSLKKGLLAASVVATGLVAGQAAHAAAFAPAPLVDFTTAAFAAADGQTSFYVVVDGIGMTFEGFNTNGGGMVAANMWWDDVDGFGVRTNLDLDEVDDFDLLRITFDSAVDLSAIFITDLFADETYNGVGPYDEQGYYDIGAGDVLFDAASLAGTDGDKTNGENVLQFPATSVTSISFSAFDGPNFDNFSVAGIDATTGPGQNEVPVPGMVGLGVLLAGLGMTGLARRKK